MPRIFTVGALVDRIRQRADMESSEFISRSETKGLLSTVYAELYSEIAATGLRHWETTATITTDGSASYAIPDDFLAQIGVDYVVDSAGHRRELEELMVQERNHYRGLSGSANAVAFSLIGSGATPLTLYPTPPSGQTYELVYLPQPEDLSDADDSKRIDVVTPDGEAFLTWGTAALMLAKEDSTEAQREASRERERLRARVIEWATMRAFNSPRRRMVRTPVDDDEQYRGPYPWGWTP